MNIFPKSTGNKEHNYQSSGQGTENFQTYFEGANKIEANNEKEIMDLKKENSILNQILSYLFPNRNKREPEKGSFSPTVAPIFRTTQPQPTVLFKRNTNYRNKFIVPTKSSTANCRLFTCKETKPSRLDHYEYDDDSEDRHRVKDLPTSNMKGFKDFSSLEEIKQILRDDPAFFTRLQGLESLRQSSPSEYGRSLRSSLGKVMQGRGGNSRHLRRILSRYRRSAGEMILKRPAIFDRLSWEQEERTDQAPGRLSPVRLYSAPPEQELPSQFYTVPTVVEPPSDFYSVPGANSPPSASFFPEATDSSARPGSAGSQLQQGGSSQPAAVNPSLTAVDPAPPSLTAVSPTPPPLTAVEPAPPSLLPRPPALTQDSSVASQQLPSVADLLPITSIFSSSSSSSSSSSTSTSTTFDRNSALLTALGLSLIPTLAISIPFLAPAFRRRGRQVPFPQEQIMARIHSRPREWLL